MYGGNHDKDIIFTKYKIIRLQLFLGPYLTFCHPWPTVPKFVWTKKNHIKILRQCHSRKVSLGQHGTVAPPPTKHGPGCSSVCAGVSFAIANRMHTKYYKRYPHRPILGLYSEK